MSDSTHAAEDERPTAPDTGLTGSASTVTQCASAGNSSRRRNWKPSRVRLPDGGKTKNGSSSSSRGSKTAKAHGRQRVGAPRPAGIRSPFPKSRAQRH